MWLRSSEPQQELCIDLGSSARIEQSVNVHLAYIVGAHVSVRLKREPIGRARIIRRLRSQGSGCYERGLTSAHFGQTEQNSSTPIFDTHRPSRAELPRLSFFCEFCSRREDATPWILLNQS